MYGRLNIGLKIEVNYEKYHHWREEKGDLDRIRALLDGKPGRRFFEIINE